MGKPYKIIESKTLSLPYESRFVIADAKTGEVLDDAQGYGFKSVQAAELAAEYKLGTGSLREHKTPSTTEKNFKVIETQSLSKYGEPRYVVVSTDTGKVLDDAQGHGYRSEEKAYAVFSSKALTVSQREEIRKKKATVLAWCREHDTLMDELFDIELQVSRAMYPGLEFDAAMVSDFLEYRGFTDLPFTAEELLKYGY